MGISWKSVIESLGFKKFTENDEGYYKDSFLWESPRMLVLTGAGKTSGSSLSSCPFCISLSDFSVLHLLFFLCPTLNFHLAPSSASWAHLDC